MHWWRELALIYLCKENQQPMPLWALKVAPWKQNKFWHQILLDQDIDIHTIVYHGKSSNHVDFIWHSTRNQYIHCGMVCLHFLIFSVQLCSLWIQVWWGPKPSVSSRADWATPITIINVGRQEAMDFLVHPSHGPLFFTVVDCNLKNENENTLESCSLKIWPWESLDIRHLLSLLQAAHCQILKSSLICESIESCIWTAR